MKRLLLKSFTVLVFCIVSVSASADIFSGYTLVVQGTHNNTPIPLIVENLTTTKYHQCNPESCRIRISPSNNQLNFMFQSDSDSYPGSVILVYDLNELDGWGPFIQPNGCQLSLDAPDPSGDIRVFVNC